MDSPGELAWQVHLVKFAWRIHLASLSGQFTWQSSPRLWQIVLNANILQWNNIYGQY